MRSFVLLGALPAVVVGLGIAAVDETCSVDGALQYLTCQVPGPGACLDSLAEQADDWCRAYLSIEPVTTYASTSVPVVQETTTETSTTATTTTEVTTTTTETTATLTATEVEQVTVTTTVAGAVVVTVVKRTISAPPSCPTLNQRNLRRRPAYGLSSACSCLNPQPLTVTLPVTTAAVSTATATETAVITDVVSETSVSSEVSVTEVTEVTTVTSTSTATATVAPVPDRCSVGYNASGNGQGNTAQTVPGVTSQMDCCQRCQAKANCIASAYSGTMCQHLVKTSPLAGAPVNDQCPLGVESYNFGAPAANGIVFKGPCAA